MLKKELASQLIALRVNYSQACADNARLRLRDTALSHEVEELSDAVEDAGRAFSNLGREFDAYRREREVPIAHVNGVDYHADTMKRIAIKYRATARYNRELHRYEIYQNGAWDAAPRS